MPLAYLTATDTAILLLARDGDIPKSEANAIIVKLIENKQAANRDAHARSAY